MTSKKIYLIRHGQTDFNLRGIVQGSGVDSSLNDTGRAQALAFFKIYGTVPIDLIYTSNLKRSVESVKDFIGLGLPHEKYIGLNEISWGKKEGQIITPDEDAYYHWMLKQWQQGDTSLRIEGGESPEDVAMRQKPVIESICSSAAKNILICMHGRAMRILLCQLFNLPLKNMDTFEHFNLCLYQLEYSRAAFSMVKHNDVSHLASLNKEIQTPVT
ncbi:MAG: histidine phosphatase family protein [Bacteroidia bacterium]|nr:histidine phosphatase family protein [Bacteroidia bacterium]